MPLQDIERRLQNFFGEKTLPIEFFWNYIFTDRSDYLSFLQIVVVDLFQHWDEIGVLMNEVVLRRDSDVQFLEKRNSLADRIEAIYKTEKIVLDDKKQNVLSVLRGRE